MPPLMLGVMALEGREEDVPPLRSTSAGRQGEEVMTIVRSLIPSARDAFLQQPHASFEKICVTAAKLNVWNTIEALITTSTMVYNRVAAGALQIHDAYFDVLSGEVQVMGQAPLPRQPPEQPARGRRRAHGGGTARAPGGGPRRAPRGQPQLRPGQGRPVQVQHEAPCGALGGRPEPRGRGPGLRGLARAHRGPLRRAARGPLRAAERGQHLPLPGRGGGQHHRLRGVRHHAPADEAPRRGRAHEVRGRDGRGGRRAEQPLLGRLRRQHRQRPAGPLLRGPGGRVHAAGGRAQRPGEPGDEAQRVCHRGEAHQAERHHPGRRDEQGPADPRCHLRHLLGLRGVARPAPQPGDHRGRVPAPAPLEHQRLRPGRPAEAPGRHRCADAQEAPGGQPPLRAGRGAHVRGHGGAQPLRAHPRRRGGARARGARLRLRRRGPRGAALHGQHRGPPPRHALRLAGVRGGALRPAPVAGAGPEQLGHHSQGPGAHLRRRDLVLRAHAHGPGPHHGQRGAGGAAGQPGRRHDGRGPRDEDPAAGRGVQRPLHGGAAAAPLQGHPRRRPPQGAGGAHGHPELGLGRGGLPGHAPHAAGAAARLAAKPPQPWRRPARQGRRGPGGAGLGAGARPPAGLQPSPRLGLAARPRLSALRAPARKVSWAAWRGPWPATAACSQRRRRLGRARRLPGACRSVQARRRPPAFGPGQPALFNAHGGGAWPGAPRRPRRWAEGLGRVSRQLQPSPAQAGTLKA
mmetsp:Transcript_112142/g.362064  ORF Transcript_112142/g.362064 Transcript_112142/m.362064 type:complete len:744 (-) Transcript_112142:43-2274(-)